MSKRGAEDVLESPRLQGPIQSTTENTSNAFAGKTADELKDLYAQISNNAAVPMAEKEDFIQKLLKSQEYLQIILRSVAAQFEIEKKKAEDAERLLAEAQVKAQHLALETEANKQRAESTQRLLAESQGKLAQIKDVRVTNPFALVLIDGDGYIFPEDLLRQGIQGGETAAHRLHELIEKWFQRDPRCKDTDAAHWRIKVRIYLNLDGLSRTLCNAKIVPDLQTLRQFMIGFTRNQQLFDVVDVGYGKERTDYKIKANFDNDIHNSSCKYVILGCAHDNGYIPMLESYKNNDRVRKRISVLSNEAATQQFKALIGATRTQSGVLEFKPFGELGLPVLQSFASLNKPTRSPNSPKLAIGLPLKPRPTPPQSPVAPPPPIQKSHYYPQPIYINQADQRVDQPTPDPSPEASQRIHNANPKLCNNYHLVGHCPWDQCKFDHTPLSSVDEIWALARYARNKPCNAQGLCRTEKCVFGHHCLQDVAGRCFHGQIAI